MVFITFLLFFGGLYLLGALFGRMLEEEGFD